MNTITISDVLAFITKASDADMTSISYAMKHRRESKRVAMKANLAIGDRVKFQSSKDSGIYVAKVVKVARKRATCTIVECTNLRYPMYNPGTVVTVPMEMLNF